MIGSALRRLFARFPPGVLVLGYHRIAKIEQDPYELCVTPQRFEEHLDLLKRHLDVLPLDDIARGLHRQATLPRRAVALTFDDGYADNFLEALPRLKSFGLPATFYVFTGWIGSNRESWWDDLERMILAEAALPERLTVLEDDGGLDTTNRRELFQRLHTLMKQKSGASKSGILDQLHTLTKIPWEARTTHRPMTEDELRDLASTSDVDIGFHTVTHPFLPALPEGEQHEEIAESRAWLERTLNRPIKNFSYPHGGFTEKTVELAERAGARSACTVEIRRVAPTDHHLRIPRLMMQNWSQRDFARQLERTLTGQ